MPDKNREFLSRLIGYVFFPLEDGLRPDSKHLEHLTAIKWAMHDAMDRGAYDDFAAQFSQWAKDLFPAR